MTRKDFELIACVLGDNRPPREMEMAILLWHNVIDDMCVELKAINPRFNEETFRKACNQ